MNPLLSLYQRMKNWPAGGWLFSRIASWKAPYFRTIGATIDVLETGRCIARIRDRWSVHNHIGTVHAIALCNLAEFVGGIGTEASTPASMRWIPKGMTVRYLKKAKGTMTATAVIPTIVEGASADLPVAVSVRDPAGEEVFDAVITMWVSPRK